MQIRSINLTDIPTIFRIETQIHSHPWTEQMFMDCFKSESTNLGYSGFVLEVLSESKKATKTIAAYLIIQIILDECHILTIGVDKKYQKQGFGTQLINHLYSQQLISNPIRRILLEVNESNDPAIQCYKKQGFKCIAERKNYYAASINKQPENALILEKLL